MMRMTIRAWMLVVPAALLLAGCVTTPMQKKAKQAAQEVRHTSQSALDSMSALGPGYFQPVDGIFVGGEAIPIVDRSILPEVFDTHVRMQRQVPVNLQMVAQFITTTVGVEVKVTPDARTAAQALALDPMRAALSAGGGAGTSRTQGSFMLHYQGTLEGLLDRVVSRTGNSWNYDADTKRIVVSHFQTETFYIAALPVSVDTSVSVTNQSKNTQVSAGGAGGGGGQGGGQNSGQQIKAGQAVQSDAQVAVLVDASEAIKTMLSDAGQIAVDHSSHAITVTDTPVALARVTDYVETLNEHLRRQVALEVKVFSLDIKRGEQYGVNWDLIYQTLNGRYGITTNAFGSLGSEANSIGLSVIDPSYNYNGSKLLLQALATQGRLVARKTVGLITLSGRPVPIQVASQTGYLAKQGTTLVANAGAVSEMIPGSVTTGFAMNVLPIVLNDHHVMMQIAINISSLRGIRTITNGRGGRIETPNVDTRQFMQQVVMPSDGTLVISGYDAGTFNSDSRGIGSPHFWLAGGSADSKRDRTMLVILVTPKVM